MDYKDLQKIQNESAEQALPQQKKVLSAADKIRRKTSNLPDPTHPPIGWQDGKGYDHIFQYDKKAGEYEWFDKISLPKLYYHSTVIESSNESDLGPQIDGTGLKFFPAETKKDFHYYK